MLERTPEELREILDTRPFIVKIMPSGRALLLGLAVGALACGAVVAKIGIDPILSAGRGLIKVASESPPQVRPLVAPPAEATSSIGRGASGVGRSGYDPLSDLPPDAVQALTRSELQGGQPFRFQMLVTPADLCAEAAKLGLVNHGWARNGLGEGFNCMTDLVPLTNGGGTTGAAFSSWFFDARGPDETQMTSLRFKLNLDNPSDSAHGRELLLKGLNQLAVRLSWSLPAEVTDAIRAHRKLSLFSGGIAVAVYPESDPVERVNVVLMLQTPAERLKADHFAALPAFPGLDQASGSGDKASAPPRQVAQEP